MTLLVWDGTTLIADKYIGIQVGDRAYGREEQDPVTRRHKKFLGDIRAEFNDAVKIRFPKEAKWNDKRIICWGMAGNTVNLGEIDYWLKHYDFKDYLKGEYAIGNLKERRNLNDENQFMFLVDTGDGKVDCLLVEGNSVKIGNKRWIHAIGSGSYSAKQIDWWVQEGLTSLEAFAIGSTTCDSVSRNFDYYHHPTNTFKQNQTLTNRQFDQLCARAHSKMDMVGHVKEHQWINQQ